MLVALGIIVIPATDQITIRVVVASGCQEE